MTTATITTPAGAEQAAQVRAELAARLDALRRERADLDQRLSAHAASLALGDRVSVRD